MGTNGHSKLFSTLALSIALTACGGGGGGGGSDQPESAPERETETVEPLTALPKFLESAKSNCEFTENDVQVSLNDYRGDLENVTALTCLDTPLTDLNEVNLLPALKRLVLTNTGLTSIDELLSFASQLESLNLSDNQLADLVAVGQLTALTELDLTGNSLSDISELVNLLNLKTLNLADNNITDPSPLSALTNAEQVQLTGNENLECSDVFDLANSLETPESGAIVLAPAPCATVLELSDFSEDQITIDNSLQAEPFDRIVILGEYTTDDLGLEKTGEDLTLLLNGAEGTKAITFSNWFVSNLYQVGIFELLAEEYSYNRLRDFVELVESLGSGDDTFLGTNDADIVYGGDGLDILIGGRDSDTLNGGPGDGDIMVGSFALVADDRTVTVRTGSTQWSDTRDTYLFNLGDGHDELRDYQYLDLDHGLLKFGANVDAGAIVGSRSGVNLVLSLNESDSITLFNWYDGKDWRIGQIQFDEAEPVDAVGFVAGLVVTGGDGVIYGTPEIDNMNTGEGEDVVRGLDGDDVINGGADRDIVIGGRGADVLTGGPGDGDILVGSHANVSDDGTVTVLTGNTPSRDGGADIYRFELGDGHDELRDYNYLNIHNGLLQFGNGITAEMISATQEGFNLKLTIDANNSITLYNWFLRSNWQIAQIQFDGQTPISASEFVATLLP